MPLDPLTDPNPKPLVPQARNDYGGFFGQSNAHENTGGADYGGFFNRKVQTDAPKKPVKDIGITGTLKQGFISTARNLGATVDTAQGDEAGVVEAAKAAKEAPEAEHFTALMSDIAARKKALGDDPGWMDAIKAVGGAVANNPKGAAHLIASQLPNAGAAIGAGVAGAKAGSIGGGVLAGPLGALIGGTVGGIAGLFTANTALETGGKAIEAATDGSFDKQKQRKALREGAIKGGVITGVDVATLGLTKWVLNTTKRAMDRATTKVLIDNGVDVNSKAALKAAQESPEIVAQVQNAQKLAQTASNKIGKRLSRGSGALALESLGEGTGEYLGEYAATGKADKVDAAIEAISGFGQSLGEVALINSLNKKGLSKLFGSKEEAEKAATEETKATGVPHTVEPHPDQPDKFVAVPKVKSTSGINLERDADGNLTEEKPKSTQADFNIANKPGFMLSAADKVRQQEQQKAADAAYAKNPIIVPGAQTVPVLPTPRVAGRPVTDLSNNTLIYTANRGSARAKTVAVAELERRKSEPVNPIIANAPETPSDAANRIISTGQEKAQNERKPNAAPIPSLVPNTPAARPASAAHIVLPDNTHLPAQWDVVDADSVKASIKEGVNQPRDRSRAASDVQVQGIANNPDYHRLSDSPIMDVGSPTLSHDGAIVGGNGRFEGISRAYDQGSAGDYLARLKADAAAKGIDPAKIDAMKKPVLVRRITQPFDTRKLAIASNSGTGLQYSGLEMAKIDAERMKGMENLDVTDTGDIALTSANIQSLRHTLSGYSPAELGSLLDKNGQLSQEGVRRIRNAMLYSAYGSNPTLKRLVESTDNDLRNISGALVKAAGSAAKVRAAIKDGSLPAELDISDNLVSAVETLSKLKAQGMSVDEYLAQSGLFGEEVNADTREILRVLEANIRSQKKVSDFIKAYYDAVARIDLSTKDIFGANPPTKPELLKNAKERITEKQPVSQDLFARPASSSGAQSPKQPINNESPPARSEKDQVKPAEPKAEGTGGASPAKKKAVAPKPAPAPTPKPEEKAPTSDIRSHVEALIKRRAAARQIGKERTFDKALADAKAMLAGETISPARFKNAANLLKNDKASVDILNALQAKAEESKKAAKSASKKPAFSRTTTSGTKSLAQSHVESVVNAIKSKWKNAPEVVIIDNMSEAPADVQEENDRQLSLGATGEPEGFISDGKVYIVASAMKTPGDVVRVLLHESLGHFGLRGVFGEELHAILKQVAALRRGNVAAKAKQYGLDMSNESDRLIAAEEVLAELAENNTQNNFVQRAIAAIRKWLRQNIPGLEKLQLSDSEIIEDILIPARQFVQERRSRNNSSFEKFNDLKSKLVEAKTKFKDAKGSPITDLFKLSNDIHDARDKYAAELAKLPDDSFALQAETFQGKMLSLTKSAQQPGKWQLTRFDAKGEPYGDTQYTTKQAAIEDFLREAEANSVTSMSGIMFSRSPAAVKSAIKSHVDKALDSLIYNFQDRFKPLKDIQKRAGPVAEEEDAALAEERYSGMVRARTDNFEAEMRDPLIKAIHDSGVSYEDVEQFLHALHAPSRNAAMQEINPTEPELKAQTDKATQERDRLANDPDVKDYIKTKRELRQAQADIEDGIADESLGRMLQSDLSKLQKLQTVRDFTKATDKLRGLRNVKPFVGDNTALSGMSNAESKAILAKIDGNGTRKALDKISTLVDAITSKTRQIFMDAGLEKPETINSWNNKYEHYVPLHRDEVNGNSMPRIGQGFNIRGKESKRATGSNKEVTNILAHVVAQHEAAIIRAEKSRVDKALFKFAQTHPDPSLWTLDTADTIRTVNPATGLVENRVDPTYKNRPNVLTLKIDGEEHTITFDEKNEEGMRLAMSMKNLSAQQLGEVTQLVGKLTRFLATMSTTANPVFGVRNFLRDLQTSYVNLSDTELASKKAEVFKGVPGAIKGMWDMTRGKKNSVWAKHAAEFKAAGGQTGWMDHYNNIGERAASLKKELDAMGPGKAKMARRTATALWNVVQDSNNAIENGVRLSAYVQARKDGMSEGKAASLAKNLTVNFNAHGAKGVELNAWYMFMNASIQGSARLIKALSNKQVQHIVGGIIVSGFMMDMLARSLAADEDDDGENDYDQLPEHVKSMNFVFMVDNRPVTIPMPYGYNFFASVGRKMSEAIFRENYSPVKSGVDLASVFLGAFSPVGQAGSMLQYAAPTVADPLIQWAENKNFAGNPLRREQHPFGTPKPEYQMGFKSTSAPAKWLTEALNDATGGNEVRPGLLDLNPALFDFAVASIAGGMGKTTLQTLSAPVKIANDEELQAREIPFLNIFLSAKPEYQVESKYYDALRSVNTAKDELKNYRGNAEMIAQLRAEHGNEIRLVPLAKATQDKLADLRKRDLKLDKLDPPNKRELRKAIEEKKRAVMARFNKRYREALRVE